MYETKERDAAQCCHDCWAQYVRRLPDDAPFSLRLQPGMILCPFCGNKRCPSATYHRNRCTGSNEPGQRGSVYQAR